MYGGARGSTALDAPAVKAKAKDLGADLVGIVDCATLAANPPDPTAPQTPAGIFPTANSCIVLAVRMPTGQFLSDHRWAIAHTTAAVCRHLERLAYRLSFWLEDQGHASMQVIMDETSPELKRGSYGYLSFRHIAVEAGLGTFGLEANLLTPEFGPRVYLNAVLTELELVSDARITEQLCIGPSCGRCLECCPTDAVGQWTLDKRECGKAAMVNGLSAILQGPVKQLLREPETVASVMADSRTREQWEAVVRVAESFGVCPRCLEVCPVGGEYQQYLASEHRYIPENTRSKRERLAAMKPVDKRGETVAGNPPINRRFVGPIGYQRLRRADTPDIHRAPR